MAFGVVVLLTKMDRTRRVKTSGMINNLVDGSADFNATALSIVSPRNLFVDFLPPITYNVLSLHIESELDNCQFTRKLVIGSPQGGVMSPLIWNVNFDEILAKLNTNKPVKVIGFADDALIMITGHSPAVMVRRIQPSINAMIEWGRKSGLEFNTSRTRVWYHDA
jgi:hypothetical protein